MNNLNRTLTIIAFMLCAGLVDSLNKPYEFLTEKINPAYLNYNFNDIYRTAQPKNFIVVTSTPTTSDGTDGNIWLLANSDSQLYIMVKHEGAWYKVMVQ